MTKTAVVLLLSIAAFALVSLAAGAALLGTILPGGLPLGNALAAIGLCSAAAAAVGLSRRGTWLRLASLVSFTGAVAWLPVSAALAGNVALNFSGERGTAWLVLSLAVTAAVLCSLGWALAASLLAMYKRGAA